MTYVITSLKNQRVKSALKLRDRRSRETRGCTLIDGTREILRALDAAVEFVEVFTCQQYSQPKDCRLLLEKIRQMDVAIVEVSPRIFEKISFGQRLEGIVAIAKIPRHDLSTLRCQSNALFVLLDRVEKPGNIGAIIRTADGAGASALIVVNGGTDIYNPNAIRASLGTIFAMPVCRAGAEETKRWLIQQQVRIVAADVQCSVDYDQADLTGPVAIVLGREADGLSPIWKDDRIARVRLPMLGTADSLNVSSAAAILLYEALRQRRRIENLT